MRASVTSLLLLMFTACGQRIITLDGGLDAGVQDGGAGDAGTDGGLPNDSACEDDAGSGGPPTVVRLVAANTTSGNHQQYEGPGTRIFQALEAEVILVQEFNVDSSTSDGDAYFWSSDRAWVDEAFGPEFHFWRETGADDQIPNGVVSRLPILASGEWTQTHLGGGETRDYVWARIDLPGSRELFVVSVHLYSGTSSGRSAEASELVGLLEANVPACDYLVVGGDLNTDGRGEAAVTTLGQRVVTAGPHPADHAGNTHTNASRARPYDWLLVDEALDALEIPVVIGQSSFPNGLVFDSRVYTPLSEVSPVLQTDSAAGNMQHMAVMRAFAIPAP